ncbi:MAG: VOC family protein [Gemmatimonadaceae bacterium]
MPRVNHFEIHATNPEILIRFYTQLFGWTFEPWGPPDGYWMIRTGDDAESGINGGLLPRRSSAPASGQPVNASVCTVRVASARESYAAALSLGGSEALPVAAIPAMGWLGYVKDPDGNLFGVMSEDARAI